MQNAAPESPSNAPGSCLGCVSHCLCQHLKGKKCTSEFSGILPCLRSPHKLRKACETWADTPVWTARLGFPSCSCALPWLLSSRLGESHEEGRKAAFLPSGQPNSRLEQLWEHRRGPSQQEHGLGATLSCTEPGTGGKASPSDPEGIR